MILSFRGAVAATALVGILAAATLAAPITPGAAANRVASTPDVTTLFGQAVKIVRGENPPAYAHAVVLEVDGSTSNGQPATSAAEITDWRFVFDNQGSRSPYASATIEFESDSGFGKVVGNRSPFLEDLEIKRAPKMTLTQAVARLRRTGHPGAFSEVVLRNPLGPTPNSKPLYIFSLAGGGFFAVNTVTGKVSALR